MRIRFKLWHLPLFMISLLGALLSIVLHLTAPKDSLLDYALSLDSNDTFVCEDGSLWKLNRGGVGRAYVRLVGSVADKRFRVVRSAFDASKLLPHEYAMATEQFRLIFVRGDGSVWLCPYTTDDKDTLLIPFYIEPELIPCERAIGAVIKPARADRSAHSSFDVMLDGRSHTVSAYLSVQLKNGKYYLSRSTGKITTYSSKCTYNIDLPSNSAIYRSTVPGNYMIEFCIGNEIFAQRDYTP